MQVVESLRGVIGGLAWKLITGKNDSMVQILVA